MIATFANLNDTEVARLPKTALGESQPNRPADPVRQLLSEAALRHDMAVRAGLAQLRHRAGSSIHSAIPDWCAIFQCKLEKVGVAQGSPLAESKVIIQASETARPKEISRAYGLHQFIAE